MKLNFSIDCFFTIPGQDNTMYIGMGDTASCGSMFRRLSLLIWISSLKLV